MISPCAYLRSRFRPTPPRAGADTRVVLVGRRQSRTAFEWWILTEMADAGMMRREALIERLTDRWMREELASGAGVVDAFLWAPTRIRREVQTLLATLEGDYVRTVDAEPRVAPATYQHEMPER